MAALIAYAAGLTTSGMEILSQALTDVFGEISIQELCKDNLRYGVRMSMKSSSIVLVVLDSSSEDQCRDIENGLYLSDKYYSYTTDRELVCFLNKKYDLQYEVPEDIEEMETVKPSEADSGSSKDSIEVRERYEAQLADKNALIQSLTCSIRGLEKIISEGGYETNSADIESVEEENRSLRSTVSDLQSKLDDLTCNGSHSDKEIEELTNKLGSVRDQLKSLQDSYNGVNKELIDLKVESSKKSGVIRDKESEIGRLSKQIEGLTEFVSQHKDCETTITSLSKEVNLLKISLKDKEEEIKRLQDEMLSEGKTQEQLEIYKNLLGEKQCELDNLRKEYSALEGSLSNIQCSLDSVLLDKEQLEQECSEYREKVETSEDYIAQLNTKNVELSGKVRVLEQSTSRNANIEDILAELAEYRRKYSELQGNIFNILYSKAMPKSASNVALFNTVGINYNNIRFVFSGNSESRKGTYKSLLNEMTTNSQEKYLLVDVVSETFVDYVFKIGKMVNGLKWFTDGGGVQQYITQTCLPNVRVLSPGLGYINDSFFLAIKWEKRLQELESSGYKVVIYCGDLSNVVGRVLFENFADMGKTDIYVHGNSVGSRTIVGISRGISNIRKATIKYFEYNPQVSKFVSHMKQKCTCEVISSVSR